MTSFATNTVDLSGYLFVDANADFPDGAWRLPDGLSIRPRESIIFVREGWPEVSDAARFREWWGDSKLPADLQIFFYPQRYGFDQFGDAARLWDANSNVVDQVYFGETRRGFTFAYDTNSGTVLPSALGVCDAFQAATCGDIGSPGWAPCGPVPMRITRPPVSQTVDAGTEVTFQVEATGLPKPRGYQWYFNSTPIPIAPGVSDVIPLVVNYAGCGLVWKRGPNPNDLIIPNVQPSQAGQYFVVFSNGLERATSAVVTLTVNTNLTPPSIKCPPEELRFPMLAGQAPTDLIVSPWQTATFDVLVRGYPPPSFRWSWSADGTNFSDLPGATNHMLMIPYVLPGHAGIYRVRMQNSNGVTNAFATLIVKDKPRLKITEAMSNSADVYEDWWELTNVGDDPVNLYGFRWDDGPGNIGAGPIITNNVVVQPGESVIFLEGHTPEFFTAWWGASNLPMGLQFITYTANGLEAEGDEINVWNPTASDDSDWVDSAGILESVTPGASFWFAPNDPCSEFGVRSDAGECGAFPSAQGQDVGSPGWTPWTPPHLTSIRRDGPDVRLEWKAQPGSTTLVQYTYQLASSAGDAIWSDLGVFSFPGAIGTATDAAVGGGPQRFYRVKTSPANCPCVLEP